MSIGGLVAAFVTSALALPWAAPAAPGEIGLPCRASVLLEPPRAYVGQQVIYRLQTFRNESVSAARWLDPLAFPSFRVEWLPSRSPDPRVAGVGDHPLVFEERRALFPVRAGRLVIPPARMLCQLEQAGQPREVAFQVPKALLEVLPLPEEGRPAQFSGVVGRVSASASLARARFRLGDAVRFAVTVQGPANVWRATAPLEALTALPELEVFALPPNLTLEAGAQLLARRTFRYDLVPRQAGPLVIPALAVPYFDPERGAYALAETPEIELDIEPGIAGRPGSAREAAAVAADVERTRTRLGRDRGRRVLRAIVMLAGLGLLTLAALVVIRRRAIPLDVRARLDAADQSRRRGDCCGEAEALAQALHAALERRMGDARALAAEELLARPGLDGSSRAAAELLVALDRRRFAADASTETGGAGGPDRDRIRRVIRDLLRGR